ncbi:MAG: DUF4919 domain-containing protein [Bacteroidota bacterium]|jgi:hypothetical protein
MKFFRVLLFFAIISTAIAFSLDGEPGKPTRKPNFKHMNLYDDLLSRVKKGDSTVDFFDLRMAFSQTKEYLPYADAFPDLNNKILESLKKKNYSLVVDYCNELLDKNYTDLYAHFFCDEAYAALNVPDKSRYHRYFWQSLMNSILKSGDGLTNKTAYMIITSKEEYFMLFIHGYETKTIKQESLGGEPIDIYTGVSSRNNDTLKVHFNASVMLNYFTKFKGVK